MSSRYIYRPAIYVERLLKCEGEVEFYVLHYKYSDKIILIRVLSKKCTRMRKVLNLNKYFEDHLQYHIQYKKISYANMLPPTTATESILNSLRCQHTVQTDVTVTA